MSATKLWLCTRGWPEPLCEEGIVKARRPRDGGEEFGELALVDHDDVTIELLPLVGNRGRWKFGEQITNALEGSVDRMCRDLDPPDKIFIHDVR
jgi:hypothetical protein